jgi:glycosyltransferase involved in cell wall biosynthesis
MKILMVKKTGGVGGIQSFMLSLASQYPAQGHHCELFFFERGPTEQFIPTRIPAHFGNLADCLRLIKTKRFDVVHANDGDWEMGISAARHLGVKLIVTSHGWVKPGTWTYGWTSDNCDAYTACSDWVRNKLEGFTDLSIKAVLNGVDLGLFRPQEEMIAAGPPPICAWVGRGTDVEFKRLDKFAEIAPLLAQAGLRLWLIEPNGPDEVAKVLPEAVSALRPVVEFWGGVPGHRMPHIYQSIAASGGAVVSTSSREGLPLTLLEAQACGCPVIGPDVFGVNECVRPQSGGLLYSPSLGAKQLADLVITNLFDGEKMKWRGRQCSQFVRAQFGLERMAREYLAIYKEAPYHARDNLFSLKSARLRLSPLLHWNAYLDQRWRVGRLQYETSQNLSKEGEAKLASLTARAAFVTSPTIFLKPARAAHLFKNSIKKLSA